MKWHLLQHLARMPFAGLTEMADILGESSATVRRELLGALDEGAVEGTS